jgi:hypothetical protein
MKGMKNLVTLFLETREKKAQEEGAGERVKSAALSTSYVLNRPFSSHFSLCLRFYNNLDFPSVLYTVLSLFLFLSVSFTLFPPLSEHIRVFTYIADCPLQEYLCAVWGAGVQHD